MNTDILVDTIQYKGCEVGIMSEKFGVRPNYTESKCEFVRTIEFSIAVKGIFKFHPNIGAKLKYQEDLKPSTVIGDVYKNAFEYAKSIIDEGCVDNPHVNSMI